VCVVFVFVLLVHLRTYFEYIALAILFLIMSTHDTEPKAGFLRRRLVGVRTGNRNAELKTAQLADVPPVAETVNTVRRVPAIDISAEIASPASTIIEPAATSTSTPASASATATTTTPVPGPASGASSRSRMKTSARPPSDLVRFFWSCFVVCRCHCCY
jgi:hypothetical protein